MAARQCHLDSPPLRRLVRAAACPPLRQARPRRTLPSRTTIYATSTRSSTRFNSLSTPLASTVTPQNGNAGYLRGKYARCALERPALPGLAGTFPLRNQSADALPRWLDLLPRIATCGVSAPQSIHRSRTRKSIGRGSALSSGATAGFTSLQCRACFRLVHAGARHLPMP